MDVDAVLASKQSQYKSTDVQKEVELRYDNGNLLASDLNTVDTDELRRRKDDYLKELMRDNTQLLINKIWELPTEKTEGLVLAEMPTPTTVLPREKPIPKPKPPTRWELFAKTKGIKNEKRSRMVFDEKSQEWKPRWGYKRVDDPKDEWMVEIPENANPYDDHFEKKTVERKEKIAKNEFQRLRNIARAQKGRIKVPLPPPHTKDFSKHQLTQAMGLAKTATASVGKFTPSLPKEPTPKKGKKSKFEPVVGNASTEKARNLDILAKIGKRKGVLDVKKAVNVHIAEEQRRVYRKRKAEGDEEKPKTKRKNSGASYRKPQKSAGAAKYKKGRPASSGGRAGRGRAGRGRADHGRGDHGRGDGGGRKKNK